MGDRSDSQVDIRAQPAGILSCFHEDWPPSTYKARMKKRVKTKTGLGNLGFYLDELPDVILEKILSKMGVKEAARSAVVCRRWRNLWTFSTHETESSGVRRFDQQYLSSGAMVFRYRQYISTQDYVVLGFDRDRGNRHLDHSKSMNKWIESALFQPVPALDSATLRNATLTAIHLYSVYVSCSDFEDFFRLCPNLESLSVVKAQHLIRVRVGFIGFNASKLKHLEIQDCEDLVGIGILSARNLVSLKLASAPGKYPEISLFSQGIPKLSCITLEGTTVRTNMLLEIQKCAALEELELNIIEELELNILEMLEHTMDLNSLLFSAGYLRLLRFNNVKQLKLVFGFSRESCLKGLTLLIRACPCLQKLTLMYGTRKGHPFPRHHGLGEYQLEEHVKTNQCLKVVKFLGWCGYENEVQLANSVIETAGHLEKLVFDPSTPQCRERSGALTFHQSPREADSVKKAIACANQLIHKLKIIKYLRG